MTQNFLVLNDITAYTTTATWNSQTNAISGNGSLTSQTLGSLPITFTGSWTTDGQSITGTSIDYTITFPAFTVTFSVRQSSSPSAQTVYLYLNGTQLDQADSDSVLLPDYQPHAVAPPPPSAKMRLFL